MSDDGGTRILQPVPYTVIQRRGFDPKHADAANPGGPALGKGVLTLRFRHTGPAPQAFALLIGGTRRELRIRQTGDELAAELDLPAGGWYTGELLCIDEGGRERTLADIGPVGVGEVYVIAGQSYAGNWNDERLRVADPRERVSALDPRTGAWRVAHDPQPLVAEDQGTFGSIWPEAMGLLLSVVDVPVGVANVSVGAAASRQWLPGTPLFANLERVARLLGGFRAVLWQQGESDILESVDGAEWEARIRGIKAELDRRLGLSRPWMPAKSTLHPTVYHLPDREQAIRDAVERLWSSPGFLRGPDTDVLGGENRSGTEGRRHFSPAGQRRAGLLWFSALWGHLGSLGGEE